MKPAPAKKVYRSLLLGALLGMLVSAIALGANYWRRLGTVVASATFNPGIAPFDVRVTRVPVLVTDSDHFIVELRRGQYVVTSNRYFWPGYTPSRVTIEWPCIDQFTVTFDDTYVATCDWRWGRSATWSLSATKPPITSGLPEPGLSPYYFTPTNPIPPACRVTGL